LDLRRLPGSALLPEVFEDKRENAADLTGARRLENALQEENGAPILLQCATHTTIYVP
jgi:hypothetical protein